MSRPSIRPLRRRDPLIPITSTHPSFVPIYAASSSKSASISSLSASTSQKRPSTATAAPETQGRRKTSRTDRGAVITAGGETAKDGASPVSSRAGLTPRVRDILARDDLGTGKSPARRLFADVEADADVHADMAAGVRPTLRAALTSPDAFDEEVEIGRSTPIGRSRRSMEAEYVELKDKGSVLERLDSMPATTSASASTSTPPTTSTPVGPSRRSHSTHRLAPSPPLFSTSDPTSLPSPSSSAAAASTSASAAPAAPVTKSESMSMSLSVDPLASAAPTPLASLPLALAHLPPGLAEVDANGVQRSIHDPGFVILLDTLRSGSGVAGTLSPMPVPVPVMCTGSSGPSSPASNSIPTTPRKAKNGGAGDVDKENIPPPRDTAVSSPSGSGSGSGSAMKLLPKTPSSSSAVSSSTARTGFGFSFGSPAGSGSDAPWSKHSRHSRTSSEAEVDAALFLSAGAGAGAGAGVGLSPSRYHANTNTNTHVHVHRSGTGPGTPGHVRVKSKLAEEILRSPTRSRGCGRGKHENGEEGADADADANAVPEAGDLTPGPITRRRAKMIRS